MTGANPTPSNTTSPALIDQDWVEDELIPFLEWVFADEHKTQSEWARLVLFARHNLDRVVSNSNVIQFRIRLLRSTQCISSSSYNSGKIHEVLLGYLISAPSKPTFEY
jgi:hypothetical protein